MSPTAPLPYRSPWMNEELDDLRALARRFCEDELAAHIDRFHEQHAVDREVWTKAGELGLLGLSVPEEYGGGGGTFAHEAVVALEQARAGDDSWGFVVHAIIVMHYVLAYGTEEQKQRWLPKLCSGEYVGAVAMTEPGAGSDLKRVSTRAVRDGDDWLISGSKAWITSGGHADLYMVMARTGGEGARGVSCFVVEAGTPGLSFGRPEEKMGQHAAHTTAVTFEGVRVPASAMIGEEGQGLIVALSSLDAGRIGIGVLGVGIAQAALEHAARYAAEREQFGKPIAAHQAVSFKLARMATQLEAARLVGLKAAWLKDQGQPFSKEASMAKLLGSEAAVDVTRDAVQIFGGNGYSAEYPVEKLYRDAKITEIYEGTSEIQQLVISRAVFAELEK